MAYRPCLLHNPSRRGFSAACQQLNSLISFPCECCLCVAVQNVLVMDVRKRKKNCDDDKRSSKSCFLNCWPAIWGLKKEQHSSGPFPSVVDLPFGRFHSRNSRIEGKKSMCRECILWIWIINAAGGSNPLQLQAEHCEMEHKGDSAFNCNMQTSPLMFEIEIPVCLF